MEFSQAKHCIDKFDDIISHSQYAYMPNQTKPVELCKLNPAYYVKVDCVISSKIHGDDDNEEEQRHANY